MIFLAKAWAHSDSAVSFSGLGLVVFGLTAMSVFYILGWRKVAPPARGRLSWFLAGLLTLIVALLSPIDSLSDHLASVHMVQHTLIMMVAAPMMAMASLEYFAVKSLPVSIRKAWLPFQRFYFSLARRNKVQRVFFVWLVYALTLWIWHVPSAYEAALKDPLVHDVQHLLFFATSFWFWRLVTDSLSFQKLNEGAGIIYVFVASLHAILLGALMTLAPKAWYPSYFLTAPDYGLSAVSDQQLAGLIMWMPAGLSSVCVVIFNLNRLLKRTGT